MAKGEHYSRHQQKIIGNYYTHLDTRTLQRLSELVSDLYLCEDDREAKKLWDQAARVLAKTDADTDRVARIFAEHDLQDLVRLCNELNQVKPQPPSTPAAKPAEPAGPSAPAAETGAGTGPNPAPEPAALDKGTLDRAYKAFKKRLKLTALESGSSSNRSPLSGQQSKVVAIRPPTSFPQAVWDELVKQGRLKKSGHGLYEMP